PSSTFRLPCSSSSLFSPTPSPPSRYTLSLHDALPIFALTLSAADVDGDPLTYAVVVPPSHGSLSGTAPNLTYSPAPDFNGQDSFTFKANDGLLDSVPATVALTVQPVNDLPLAASQTKTTDEEVPVQITL